MLTEIVADLQEEPSEIVMWLHWAGGVHTQLRVARNRTGKHRHCTDKNVIELLRELVKVCSDADIAAILNRLGYRTGAGNTWIESRVRSLRFNHHIPTLPTDQKREWLTLADASHELKISTPSVRKLIHQGVLTATQVVTCAPWVIDRKNLAIRAVQDAAKAICEGRRIPRSDPRQQELPIIPTCSEV